MRIPGVKWSEEHEYISVCANCGKEFTANNRASKYCSDECRKAQEKKRKEYYRLNPDAKPKRGPQPRRNNKKKENPFVEILTAAREAGMSYGQYVATHKV